LGIDGGIKAATSLGVSIQSSIGLSQCKLLNLLNILILYEMQISVDNLVEYLWWDISLSKINVENLCQLPNDDMTTMTIFLYFEKMVIINVGYVITI
jgi:hypothetical protein